MTTLQAIVDTNVILSAFRSKQGASHSLLRIVDDSRWRMNVSVALLLQYEAVVRREAVPLYATNDEATEFIDYLAGVSAHRKVHFAWRPQLADANDEFILDLAVAARATHIVTFNQSDFRGAENFGVNVVAPGRFLRIIHNAV